MYLAAFFGGTGIVWASGYVGDAPLDDAGVQRVLEHGPGVLGVVVALAIAIGLRSGAQGGPVSVEAADTRYLLGAPISRGAVLRLPYLQRLRSVAGVAALVGGTAGLLAAQRMPGTAPSWILSGAAFGACVGMLWVAPAAYAHAWRLPSWAATLAAAVIVGWQVWAAAAGRTGPFDALGDLALWGYHQRTTDLVSVVVVAAIAFGALFVIGHLSTERLVRRGDLVSQLRFAVTTQDLRTVVLLRRELRQEQPRDRPLVGTPPFGSGKDAAVLRRSFASLLRAPWTRHGRTISLGAAAGAAAGVTLRGTTPAILACGVLLFVMGLDLIEPLSQEVDHPSLTEDLPVDAGWLHLRLLAAPFVFAVFPAVAGAAVCALVAPGSAPAAFALALPITWAGMSGSVVNTLRDDVIGGDEPDAMFMPPEMTGMKNVVTMLIPLIVSTLPTLAVLAMRASPTPGVGLRVGLGLAAFLAVFGWWVLKRADLKSSWSEMKKGAMPT